MARSSSRNSQLVRILQILRELDRLDGVDLYELRDRFGVNLRTIRRDLAALQELGLPIVEDAGEGPRKRWRVAYKDQLQKLASLVDASHFMALRVAMGQGSALRKASSLFAALEDLSEKIEKLLGPKEREHLRAMDGCFYSMEKFAYLRSPPDVFWSLVSAVAEHRVCLFTYRAPHQRGRGSRFAALPLKLFVHDGAPYLLAWVRRFKKVIVLNLQRLQALKVLDETASGPRSFDPERWASAAFGIYAPAGAKAITYRLRFDAEVAPYIREREWHPTQKLKELRERRVELSFESPEDSYEVSSWVASWRNHVEVLAPPALRAELRELGGWYGDTYLT
jgi:predicted DNA-binding transcriptional regulator YafY